MNEDEKDLEHIVDFKMSFLMDYYEDLSLRQFELLKELIKIYFHTDFSYTNAQKAFIKIIDKLFPQYLKEIPKIDNFNIREFDKNDINRYFKFRDDRVNLSIKLEPENRGEEIDIKHVLMILDSLKIIIETRLN